MAIALHSECKIYFYTPRFSPLYRHCYRDIVRSDMEKTSLRLRTRTRKGRLLPVNVTVTTQEHTYILLQNIHTHDVHNLKTMSDLRLTFNLKKLKLRNTAVFFTTVHKLHREVRPGQNYFFYFYLHVLNIILMFKYSKDIRLFIRGSEKNGRRSMPWFMLVS